jgi:hypothetical protein
LLDFLAASEALEKALDFLDDGADESAAVT